MMTPDIQVRQLAAEVLRIQLFGPQYPESGQHLGAYYIGSAVFIPSADQ